jgi:stage III sporulation protein AE
MVRLAFMFFAFLLSWCTEAETGGISQKSVAHAGAYDTSDKNNTNENINTGENSYTSEDSTEYTIDFPIDDSLERDEYGFSEVYEYLKKGEMDEAFQLAFSAFLDSIWGEIADSKNLAVQIIALIILGNIFTHVTASPGDFVVQKGFLVTYMILTGLLLSIMAVVQVVAEDTVENIIEFMKAFYPMYASSLLYVQGTASAAGAQSVIVLIIYVCQNLVMLFIIPMIKCAGIVSLVNNMNNEDYFSKMSELMKSIAMWIMKTLFAVVTGINVVKSIISPSMDKVSRNGVLKTIGKISGMGSVGSVLEVILSAGEFMKNCMGMAATVTLVVISAVPLVKMFVVMILLKAIAALVQPMGERRYAAGVSSMAETVELMLKATGISVMMFVLSVAIMSFGSSV